MALYTKTTSTGLAWTNTTNWTPAGYPGTNGAADEAQWTSATSVATNTTHSVVTVGKLTITNPTGTQSTSGGSVLTIDPTSFSGIGIELTSAGATAFTLGGATALGSSQEWTVASGRTLTVSGAVSGNAKNLTLSGAGTKTLSGASTGWTNSTVTVSAGQATVSNINGLGASSNNVVVSADANLTVSAAITQTDISISGDGFTGGTGYGAFTSSNALANANVITLAADGTVLSVSTSFAATIAGSVTTATLNLIGSAALSFTGPSTYTASNGVRLQSKATNGTTANTAAYSFGTALAVTDSNAAGAANVGKGFGALTNAVVIEPTGLLTYTPPAAGPGIGTATLSRNYTFIASTSPTTTQANFAASNYGIYDWQGTVTLSGTSGQAVAINGYQNANALRNMHKFSGVLTGDAGVSLWVGDKAFGGATNTVGTVGIGTTLDSSGFQGTLVTNSIAYYAGTSNHVFPIVFRGSTNFLSSSVAILATAGSSSANHASYSREVGTATYFNYSTSGQTGDLTLGGGGYASAPGAWDTGAGTLTLNFSFNGTTGTLTKSGVSTLVLGGSNTSITATAWTAGNLTLNSVNAIGDGADAFTATSTGILDSTTGAVLAQTGVNALNANFTWKGTASLTFGVGDVTASADRTVSYANTGETGTLKFAGAITTSLATTAWNFGGSTAGAKQRITLGGANASLVAGTAADQPSVTAGYFRIENNNGLGAAATTTTWWVGATNLGVQTTKAALELAGVTTPDTKNVNLYNIGPNDDGALIGASGTSVFSGNISVPNVAGTRIGVKAGATLTLPGSGIYPNLNPANASTPLSFTAESGGTLNIDRVLGGPTQVGSNVGTVAVTGGSGTVVFSRANLHTGAMTCSAGTTKLTHVNAAGAGAGNSVTVSAGATMESTVKAVFPATLTLGSSPSTPTVFKVSV